MAGKEKKNKGAENRVKSSSRAKGASEKSKPSSKKDDAGRRAVIELKELCKFYKMGKSEVRALNGVKLKIFQGEMVAIVGPSGSGKSTLMNMVGCLDIPTCGSVYLFGRDISKMAESDLATLRGKTIGFIFQKFNLVPYLNALENVVLPMVFQGAPLPERNRRGKEILDVVKLSDRKTHKPSELSGGQQQRVSIGRALANNPQIILADEPTGNLDSETGKSIMQFMRELNEKFGKTIVIVTHDERIAKTCDRTIFIEDGKIVDRIHAL
ncbi:MAG TPA: ABC transporter ATP-binding protein [Candidatus Woesearchaeota archaeon]|nr:ABC transporter ATP-binding protein [Candidatus Woesearchaeota archaeon]